MQQAQLAAKIRLIMFLALTIFGCLPALAQNSIPVYSSTLNNPPVTDWLLQPVSATARVYLSPDKKDLILHNGLVRRSFRLQPNLACTDFFNLVSRQQLIRRISPEARLIIDGKVYRVGGLTGQKQNGYLKNEWIDDMGVEPGDFTFKTFSINPIKPSIAWKARYWTGQHMKSSGIEVVFVFGGSDEAADIEVQVVYELYNQLPLITKSIKIINNAHKPVSIDQVVSEILAMPEEESAVIGSPEKMQKQQGIYVESNYAFNNAMNYSLSDQTSHWKIDSLYTSQVNYDFNTPCILEVYPEKAPGLKLMPGEEFQSVKSFELLMDSYDRERRGLAVRKMYRTVAPWTTGNPIFMHLVSKNDEEVRHAIDQCAETGYEALIMSFGSHINMEDSSTENMLRWKTLSDYAHSKNILIGGYSLFSSRRISDEHDVINPKTGKPGGTMFGNAPCFGSKWGLEYREKIKYFFEKTGFDMWENDGPYPGDICASTSHPGHQGIHDSQWRQIQIQKELYRWLNERGIYVNSPDWYFLDGTNKIAIGYREVNFSLPRDEQKILNRQNIYDGTWLKTPSMGWGFVPLTRYQGGGPEAILEPLNEHLADYEQLMMQYYGAGVQACYRGPRLYDTDQTKEVVIRTINWYKKYRRILNADIIHLRRADGRDWDGILHVDPSGKEKGLLMIYNPLNTSVELNIKLPLYYTGLTSFARIREKEGTAKKYKLHRDYSISLKAKLPAQGYSWFVIE